MGHGSRSCSCLLLVLILVVVLVLVGWGSRFCLDHPTNGRPRRTTTKDDDEHEKEHEQECDTTLRVDIRSHGQHKDQAHESVALKECLIDARNVQMRRGPMLVNQSA
jgi:hypothetical protein